MVEDHFESELRVLFAEPADTGDDAAFAARVDDALVRRLRLRRAALGLAALVGTAAAVAGLDGLRQSDLSGIYAHLAPGLDGARLGLWAAAALAASAFALWREAEV